MRSGLVKKRTTRSDGVVTTVWVRPDKDKPKEKTFKKYPDKEVAELELRNAPDEGSVDRFTHAILTQYISGSKSINLPLRGEGDLTKDKEQRVKRIDQFLDENRMPDNIKTYRGLALDPQVRGQKEIINELDGLEPGDTIHDDGFLSTSLDEEIADSFMSGYRRFKIEINIPKGSKATFMQNFGIPLEHEVLVQRGADLEFQGKEFDGSRYKYVFNLRSDEQE